MSDAPIYSEQTLRDLIAALGDDWPKIREQERARNLSERHHFRPLSTISIKETDHSRLLGSLLQPDGDHGEGPRFLHSFLEMIGIEDPAAGTWKVTIESGRIDILLVRSDPLSVVIVENKARGAVDQPAQLYRYWFQEIYWRDPNLDYAADAVGRRFKIIYAPPGEFMPVSPSSMQHPDDETKHAPGHPVMPLPVTYCDFRSKLAPWLLEMSKQVSAPRLRIFLQLYAEIWTFP